MTHEISPLVRSATVNSFLSSVYSLLHCSWERGLFILQPTVMLMMKEEGKLFAPSECFPMCTLLNMIGLSVLLSRDLAYLPKVEHHSGAEEAEPSGMSHLCIL
ncbi:uncharacterized protein LJ206_007725 isoform 1-T2 [Theristicus caerulescens]